MQNYFFKNLKKMKLLVQRVKSASVRVDASIIAQIEKGYVVYLGITTNDMNPKIDDIIIQKLLNIRLFEDKEDKINHSILDVKGEILVISNFTLYGNTKKGTRPSFTEAAKVEDARKIYERFLSNLKSSTDLKIETGQFQAMMDVESINDGPVNIIIEKEIEF